MSEFRPDYMTRREIIRAAGAGGAILALPSLLAACGASSSDGKEGAVGGSGTDAEIASITWMLGAAPPTLDVATGFNGYGLMVMMLGLEGLVGFGKDLKLKPILAESWSRPDPLSYVYKIRSGVTFWDGSPMTVDDVVFSLDRHLDPKAASQLSTYLGNVKSVKQTGKDEVTISLSRPDPLVEYVPAFAFVTPRAYSERLGDKLGTPGPDVNITGTGPYEVTSFSTDDGVALQRRDGYWGEKPRVRQAKLAYIGDPQTRLLALRSGEIDGVADPDFPLTQSRQWDRAPGVNTSYTPGMTSTLGFFFDVEAEPWNDVHVRRAVAHAADREGYVRAFLGGHAEPATSLVSPLLWAGLLDEEQVEEVYAKIPKYDYDLDKAKAELAKSAYPDGFTAEIKTQSIEPTTGKAAVALSETLKELNITLRVTEMSIDEWRAEVVGHKGVGMSVMWAASVLVDPADLLATHLDSAKAIPNQFNYANYKNATVDELLRDQAAATSSEERADAIGEILRIAGEELPYLPLWWPDAAMALNDQYVFEDFGGLPLAFTPDWLGRIRARA